MTRILLIRHGKAASHWGSYDQLSAVGHAQSAHLAERLYLEKEEPLALFHGTLNRQRVTAEVVRDAMTARGATLPPLTVLPALDEMPPGVIDLAIEREPPGERRRELDDWVTGNGPRTRQVLTFMLESFFAYSRDELRGDFETYGAFCQRARDSLRAMLPPGRGTVIAFTSGGVIAAAAGFAIEAPLDKQIRLMATLENTSISEVRYSRRRDAFALVRLNDIAHVPVAERTLL